VVAQGEPATGSSSLARAGPVPTGLGSIFEAYPGLTSWATICRPSGLGSSGFVLRLSPKFGFLTFRFSAPFKLGFPAGSRGLPAWMFGLAEFGWIDLCLVLIVGA
jgi:hypothetical protein